MTDDNLAGSWNSNYSKHTNWSRLACSLFISTNANSTQYKILSWNLCYLRFEMSQTG